MGSRSHRFLALGDSYTIGESVGESDRWPNQLAQRLRAERIVVDPPQIIAKTGWTTDELLAEIGSVPPSPPFDLVSLLIGVNNQYRGRDADEYASELEVLLSLAIDFADGAPARVIVLSIPDWGVTPYAAERDRDAIRLAIDEFNRRKRERSQRLGCHFVDITPHSRNAAEDTSLIASDGLHPSATMYAAWCDQVMPSARLALSGLPPGTLGLSPGA
ncbi:MAG: SGNH/GDSL hydrolase family protein [Planctomycetota bacterium]